MFRFYNRFVILPFFMNTTKHSLFLGIMRRRRVPSIYFRYNVTMSTTTLVFVCVCLLMLLTVTLFASFGTGDYDKTTACLHVHCCVHASTVVTYKKAKPPNLAGRAQSKHSGDGRRGECGHNNDPDPDQDELVSGRFGIIDQEEEEEENEGKVWLFKSSELLPTLTFRPSLERTQIELPLSRYYVTHSSSPKHKH